MATAYFFVSSYGREGPFREDFLAAARAKHLALRAALDGRDEERPRVEGSDGTSEALPPFGAHLGAEHLAELPSSFNVFVMREREAVSRSVDAAESLMRSMEGQGSVNPSIDPKTMKDRGARAIYVWALRRATVAILRQLPETRPLAEDFERRWFEPG